MDSDYSQILGAISEMGDGDSIYVNIENNEIKDWKVRNSLLQFLYKGLTYCHINHDRKSEEMLGEITKVCDCHNITNVMVSPPYRCLPTKTLN